MSNLSAREEMELRQMGQRGWLVSEMEEFLTKRERALLEELVCQCRVWESKETGIAYDPHSSPDDRTMALGASVAYAHVARIIEGKKI